MRRILVGVVAAAVRAADRRGRARAGDAMQLLHDSERVVDVLEHVREQKFIDSIVGKRKPLRAAALEIGHHIDARQGRRVDVHPAGQARRATSEIELQSHVTSPLTLPGC